MSDVDILCNLEFRALIIIYS